MNKNLTGYYTYDHELYKQTMMSRITDVLGFAQLLALPDGCNTEEEKAEYLSYVTNNAQMLTMLIGDILNISDVENGRYKITKAPADLAELCRMAIQTTEHRCLPGVTMEFVNGLPEGMQVETDGGRVQQLLVNLLSNACKHTSEGFIRLETSLAEHPGRVTFSVSDSGPGPEHLPGHRRQHRRRNLPGHFLPGRRCRGGCRRCCQGCRRTEDRRPLRLHHPPVEEARAVCAPGRFPPPDHVRQQGTVLTLPWHPQGKHVFPGFSCLAYRSNGRVSTLIRLTSNTRAGIQH